MSLSQAPLILVVDDEISLRFLLQNRLKKAGYNVEFAENGEQALMKIRGGCEPRLILTDFTMPGLDGLSLVHKLRDEGREIPFILMTGFPNAELEQRAQSLGVLDIFAKPFSYRQVITRIKLHLKTESEQEISEKSG